LLIVNNIKTHKLEPNKKVLLLLWIRILWKIPIIPILLLSETNMFLKCFVSLFAISRNSFDKYKVWLSNETENLPDLEWPDRKFPAGRGARRAWRAPRWSGSRWARRCSAGTRWRSREGSPQNVWRCRTRGDWKPESEKNRIIF